MNAVSSGSQGIVRLAIHIIGVVDVVCSENTDNKSVV